MGISTKPLIAGLSFILFAFQVAAKDEVVQKNSSQLLSLKGRVETRTFYGPPGYGEMPDMDSRETVAILFLNQPLGFSIQELAPNKHGDEITLQLVGKNVPTPASCLKISGTLTPRRTGHHHTDLLLEAVSSVPCIE